MSDQQQKYEIRLAVVDGKIATAEMKEFGATGKKAFQDITDGASIMDRELGRLQSSLVGRLTAVLGPTALMAGIKAATAGLAEIEGAAQKAGWAIEELQVMRYVAVQFGESADSMSTALVEFNKRVGEAQSGQGKLLDVLKQYDVKLVDVNGRQRTSAEIYKDFSNRVRDAATEQEKMRLAVAAFGNDAGKGLVDILAMGSDRLSEFEQSARAAGVVIEEELIIRAKKLDDQFKVLLSTLDTYWKAGLVTAVTEAIDLFDRLSDKVSTTARWAEDFWTAYKENTGSGDVFRDFDRRLQIDQNKQYNKRVVGDIDILMGQQPRSFGDWIEKSKIPTLPESDGSRKEREKAEEAALKKQQAVVDMLRFRNEQMRRTNDEQELYNQLRAAGTTLDTAAGQEIQRMVEEYQKYQTEIRKTKEGTEALTKAADGYFERIIDGFADGKISAEEMQQAFLQLFKEIILARDSATGESLFPNIMGQVSSGIGGFVKSIFGFEKGGIMTAGGPLPLRMYSAGGIANSPQVAVYGEGKKPEAYVPLPDGRTIPVTMNGGGGLQLNVQIIDQVGVDTQAKMSSNGKSLQVTLRDKMRGMVRGGELDSAFRDRMGVGRTLRDV